MKSTELLIGSALIVGAGGSAVHQFWAVPAALGLGLLIIPIHKWEKKKQRRKSAERRLFMTIAEVLKTDQFRGQCKWEDKKIVAISIRYHPGLTLNAQTKGKLVEAMADKMGGPVSISWRGARDSFVVTLRPVLPDFVPHPVLDHRDSRIPFAVTYNGRIVFWDPHSGSPHLLVIGKTQRGKTVLVRGIVMELVRRGYQVACIDPKRVSLRGMRDWPGVIEVATNLNSMIDLLHRVHTEVDRRYEMLEAGTVESEDLPPLLLVIEEAAELIQRLNDEWKAQKKTGEHPATAEYRSIARLGAEGNVHLIICLQQPAASILTTEARDNLAARVTLGQVSRVANTMMENETQVTKAIQGRAIANIDGKEVECQIFWTPDPGKRLDEADSAILASLLPPIPRVRSTGPPILSTVHSVPDDAQIVQVAPDSPEPVKDAEPDNLVPINRGKKTPLERAHEKMGWE